MTTVNGPYAKRHVVQGRDNDVIPFFGKLLGFASSQREKHDHSVSYDDNNNIITFAEQGVRCSACRWFEVCIYKVEYEFNDDGEQIPATARYLLATTGGTIVPGEVRMGRAIWTDSPHEIIELLTQRRGTKPFLPTPSARVLAQAAAWDIDVRDAYVDRAVV